MSVAMATETVTIGFEGRCSEECGAFAMPLYKQLAEGPYAYPASTMPLPADMDDYLVEHRTARKRAARAARLGYWFAEIDREDHGDAIYGTNTSAPIRQGRPMSEGYLRRVAYAPLPEYPCPRHAVRTYGVVDAAGVLRAYTWVYRAGDLLMFSMILGHADHLENDVMYMLVVETLRAEIANGPGVCFYNRHDSGTDGLRFFKERLGFQLSRVRWEFA